MRIAIMQPYFLPYLGYFQLLNCVDKFVIFDDVNYIKKGWINRNNILVGGKAHLFTLPLNEMSQNKLINEHHLQEVGSWKAKFLKTLEMAYSKAPFYNDFYPIVKEIVEFPETNLSTYNYNAIWKICNYLDLKSEIIPSSCIYKNTNLRGQERIIDICIQENANEYYNMIGGIELYQKEFFNRNQIQLKFINSKKIQYKQFQNEFIPFLSILDVIMFNEVSKIKDEFLSSYILE